MRFIRSSVKFFLLATAFTPLIVTWSAISPFVLGKIVFFRSLIEIALIFFIISLFLNRHKLLNISINQLKSALISALILFLISLVISSILAVNPYRAFWGDIERGEGLFGFLHFFAFLIMAVAIFEKKDWLNFFKISLGVGFILILYAFLQYFEVKNFPFFALMPEARPISYIGNSAFLATHMFFLMMSAVIVFFNNKLQSNYNKLPFNYHLFFQRFWKYFSLLIIILSVLTIFMTATRGAILGLGAGILFLLVYFSIYGGLTSLWRLNLKKLAITLILIMFIFGGVFWLTRDALVWQKIPGLNRLAQTKILDVNDPSTQFRLITWKLSWNAFKEKPIFGWGPENYLVAYEKYYDPEYAVYGESWLDRAHNKVFDVLVMQGIFGLITYLGIFGVIFYLLLKSKEVQPHQINDNVQRFNLQKLARGEAADYTKPIIAALLISYFVQNLVLFDTIISYFAFFAILGYLISGDRNKFKEVRLPKILSRFAFYFIAAILIIILGYSLYFYNLVPYVQARLFKASFKMVDIDTTVYFLKKSMYPYNFAQYNIRGNGIDTIYMDQIFYKAEYAGNPKFKSVMDLLIKGVDEVVKKEPYDIRMSIREVEMLNSIARVVDEKEAAPIFKRSEELMREAIKRAPNRQEVYYHLAFNLAGQKRYEEAIETARYAISLNPNIPRAHFHLALMYAIINKLDDSIKEIEVAEKLDPDLKTLMPGDHDTTLLIYSSAGKLGKVAEMIIKNLNSPSGGISGNAFKRKYYENTLRYFAVQKDAENFIKVATYLSWFDDLKDDMEVLIDLAQKELWDIILKL